MPSWRKLDKAGMHVAMRMNLTSRLVIVNRVSV
jgi:hypothetical protein